MTSVGFSIQDLRDASCTIRELKDAGCTILGLSAAGYSAQELIGVGFAERKVRDVFRTVTAVAAQPRHLRTLPTLSTPRGVSSERLGNLPKLCPRTPDSRRSNSVRSRI